VPVHDDRRHFEFLILESAQPLELVTISNAGGIGELSAISTRRARPARSTDVERLS